MNGQGDEIRASQAQLQKNLDQLHHGVTDTLNNIEQQLARTEWSVEDLEQNLTGRLTLMQADTQSISLGSSVMSERVVEILEKVVPNR